MIPERTVTHSVTRLRYFLSRSFQIFGHLQNIEYGCNSLSAVLPQINTLSSSDERQSGPLLQNTLVVKWWPMCAIAPWVIGII